jgi:spore maturation protein CgeB
MKLFLLGKGASITHWLEDAAGAFSADGHQVFIGLVRRPWLAAPLESGLVGPLAASLRRRIERVAPDLILVIGGFHAPREILEAISTLPGRPPIMGWVGDIFDAGAAHLAQIYDAVGYTDSGLLSRHNDLAFPGTAFYLPHAANPAGPWPARARRAARMVFIANPTPHRMQVVEGIRQSIVLYGPGWTSLPARRHERHARRAAPGALRGLYGGHFAALNIRNEANVLAGLNQRNFDPLLAGAALLTDDQPDLVRCFEPGVEVLVWRTIDDLNEAYERLLAHPEEAAGLAERGRRRVLADHTYGARLKTLTTLL